ncbi:hypothetical protein DFP72DRAFT_925522 [Ephemerocybe angulata]|uniref:F-box domain-containing protein n=1 Tax=Ephemerocybe angulata TaxID=980116 RepID=A0A8H6HET6_9AGAR|nr:hypothetical protein DFP72DRAFT_925522 [Tulosesus angulatus]
MVGTLIDVVEPILSLLYRDTVTLASCSLVCREWVPYCRRWLFEDVDLTIRDGSRGAIGSRQARLYKFMDFTSTTQSPCSFTSSVERIQVDASFTPYQIAGLETIDLPKLHSLRIKPSPDPIPSYLLSAISTAFAERVDDLDITGVKFSTVLAMIKFLCAFRRLKQLALGNNTVAHDLEDIRLDFRLSPDLHSLRLSDDLGNMDPVAHKWLLDQLRSGCSNLKSFEPKGRKVTGPEVYPDCLTAISERVEELKLHILEPKDAEALPYDLTFPNLRTMHLECRVCDVTSGKSPVSGGSAGSPDEIPVGNTIVKRGQILDMVNIFGVEVDVSLGILTALLKAPSLAKIAITLSHIESRNKTNEDAILCTAHTLPYISFQVFDNTLAKIGPKSLPMLQSVEFLVDGCLGRPEDERCFDVTWMADFAMPLPDGLGGSCAMTVLVKEPEKAEGVAFEEFSPVFLDFLFPASRERSDLTLSVFRLET